MAEMDDVRERVAALLKDKFHYNEYAYVVADEILKVIPKTMSEEAIVRLVVDHSRYVYPAEARGIARDLVGKVPAQPEQPTPDLPEIEPLDYGELATCDYGDTDKVIEYIITLAKKYNELISSYNKMKERMGK